MVGTGRKIFSSPHWNCEKEEVSDLAGPPDRGNRCGVRRFFKICGPGGM
jgi:hypothetical protein